MSDGTTLNAGSGGDTIATDDISGVKHQRVKVEWGADGTANEVDTASGKALPVQGEAAENAAVTGNPVLVGARYDATPRTLGDGDVGAIALDADGAIHIADGGNSITIDGSVSLTGNLPDTSAGDLAAINSALAGTLTVDGSGVTQPVSGIVTANLSATDNAVLDAIAASVAGTLTVGSHAVTNAGTFPVQIVDTSFAVADGNALGEGVLIQGDDGTDRKNINVDATTGDVQVDITHTVTVDGSGVTQPISGTVTANLSATDNAVLDVIAASVAGTLTVGSHAVTNAGTFAVQVDGSALTALQLIDNTVYVDDADWTATTSSHNLVGGVYQSTPGTVTDGDTGPFRINANGALHVSIQEGSSSGTEYTEDAAAAANPAGGAVILVRADTPAGVTSTDGDNVAQRGTDYGAAYVQIVDSSGNFVDSFGGSGGTAAADDADFTAGTTQGTLVQGVYESSPTSVTDGDMGAIGITSTREVKVSIEADNVGIGGGTQYAVDAALGSTPTGTLALGIRDDALSSLTPVEGDAVGLRVDANGGLWVTPSGTVTVSGTVTANLSATDNAVLDTIETNTDYGTVTGGGVEAGALRVTLANDSTGVLSVDDNGGSLTVDGTVAATQSGTWNITNVSGTVSLPTGAATETTLDAVKTAVEVIDNAVATEGSALGSGVLLQGDDGTDRKNINVDATTGDVQVDVTNTVTVSGTVTADAGTGPWPVTDNGGSLTVDGTVTANLSATDNAVLDSIDAAVNGTLTVGSHAVTNAGTFAVQVDGSALTALQVIDNPVFVDDAAFTEDSSSVMVAGAVRDDEVGSTAVTSADGDAGPLRSNKFGMLKVTQMPDATSEVKYAVIDAASSGDNTLVAAAGAGIKIRVLQVFLVAAGDVVARFESGASGTALTGQMDLTTNSGFTLPFSPVGWFETADNTLLNLELDGAVSVDGVLAYVEV